MGAYGATAEQRNVLRHTRLIEDFTGVDIEAPTKMALQAAQAATTRSPTPETVTGSQYLDSAIRRRLGELSIEATGRANHPAYVAAMEDLNTELWKLAERQVRKTEKVKGTYGFISPVPMSHLGETEGAIRQATTDLPGGGNRLTSAVLYPVGHPSTGYRDANRINASASRERTTSSGSSSQSHSARQEAAEEVIYASPRLTYWYEQWKGNYLSPGDPNDNGKKTPDYFVKYVARVK
jgi:hypothetical protein